MADLPAGRLDWDSFRQPYATDDSHLIRPVTLPPLDSQRWQSSLRAFGWGMRCTGSTVLALVLFVTYIGIGALSHDTHFSLAWR